MLSARRRASTPGTARRSSRRSGRPRVQQRFGDEVRASPVTWWSGSPEPGPRSCGASSPDRSRWPWWRTVLGLAATDADTVLGLVRRDRRRRHHLARRPARPDGGARARDGRAGRRVHAGVAAAGRARCWPAVSASLAEEEVVANAAVLMFGGIETTEGMILNAVSPRPRPRPRRGPPPTRGDGLSRRSSRSRCGWSPRRRWSTATPPATSSSPGPRSRAATWSGSRWPARTATPRSSPTPTCSTRTAATPARSWGSPAARTCASRWTWPGWRPGSRCTRW